MRMGPHLVVRSAVIGSFILSVLGYLGTPFQVAAHFTYSPLVQGDAPGGPPAPPAVSRATKSEPKDYPRPPDCAVSPGYPERILVWCGLITEQAYRNQLPPDLIAALILQESGGDPGAYSHSGAVGLMQVMPRDGLAARFQCKNGPCFASRPTIRELEDPAFNVAYGVRMLAGLYRRHGDLRAALRAYGPMDVGFGYADKVLALWERFGDP